MKITGSKKAARDTARSCELGWRILGTYYAKTEEEKSRVETMTIAWLRVVRSMENGEPCYVGQALIQSASETYARKMAKRA